MAASVEKSSCCAAAPIPFFKYYLELCGHASSEGVSDPPTCRLGTLLQQFGHCTYQHWKYILLHGCSNRGDSELEKEL